MDQHVPEYMADIVRSTSANRQGYRDRAARLLSLDTHDPPIHWRKCVTAAWEFQALLMEDKKFTSQVSDAAKRFNVSLLEALGLEGEELTDAPIKPVDPLELSACAVLDKLSDGWKKANPAWRLRSDELEHRLSTPSVLRLDDPGLSSIVETHDNFPDSVETPIYVLKSLSEDFVLENPQVVDRLEELNRYMSDPECLRKPQKK